MSAPLDLDDVKWDVSQKALSEKISMQLRTGNFSDVTFLLENNNDLVKIKAHKVFLAMGSETFAKMFTQDDKINAITLTDVKPTAFTDLLKYIYLGTIELKSSEKACDLYAVADKYKIQNLKEKCITYIESNLDRDSAIKTMEFGEENGEAKLAERALYYIKKNTIQILKDDSFLRAKINTITKIFEQDSLNIDCEMDLVSALIAYKEKNSLDIESCKSPANRIRILTLTQEQIAECHQLKSIFSESQLHNALCSIILGKKIKSLEGLNESGTPRERYTPTDDSAPSVIRCKRNVGPIENANVTDSVVRLDVSEDIMIEGIKIKTQIAPYNCEDKTYTEDIRVKITSEDSNDVYLDLPYSKTVEYASTMTIDFLTPFRMIKIKKHKLSVEYKKMGFYPVEYRNSKTEVGRVIFNIVPLSEYRSLLNGSLQEIMFSRC